MGRDAATLHKIRRPQPWSRREGLGDNEHGAWGLLMPHSPERGDVCPALGGTCGKGTAEGLFPATATKSTSLSATFPRGKW